MDIKQIIERIEKESYDYFKSNKATDDWISIPKHILVRILVDEIVEGKI